MVDLENFLNSIKPASGPANTRGLGAGGETIKDTDNQFSAIFKSTVAAIKPAQSGKTLPPSGNPPIGAHYELQNRQLKSGLTVFVAGPEPSDQELSKFAADQGIDLSALKPQKTAGLPESSAHQNTVDPVGYHGVFGRQVDRPTHKPPTFSVDNSAGKKIGPQGPRLAGDADLEHSPMSPLPTMAGNPSPGTYLPLQSDQSNSSVQHSRIAQATVDLGNNTIAGLRDQPIAHQKHIEGSQQLHTDQLAKSASMPQHPKPKAAIQTESASAPNLQSLGAAKKGEADALIDKSEPVIKGAAPQPPEQLQSTGLPRLTDTDRSSRATEPNRVGVSVRASAASANPTSLPTVEKSDLPVSLTVSKDTTSPEGDSRTVPNGAPNLLQSKTPNKPLTGEVANALKSRVDRPTSGHTVTTAGQPPQSQQSTPVSQPATATATDAIQSTNTDLTDPLPKQGLVGKLDIGALRVGLVQSTHKAIPVSKVPVVVEPINLQPTQLSGVSSVSETPTLPLPSSIADSAEKHSAQVLREAPATDSSVVRDQFSQMSKTLTEALGQRIVAQLARGEWRVEMQLHPTNLGRVEIHLEMKNGELEANFYTANQITRELINEGLPRLRHALEQQGMETAYRGLEQGNQGKSNGNSAGQDNPREQYVQAPSVESSTEPTTDSTAPDGLDILI
ncbi:MAG: flagellar hook-length control protein FliK [Porticoccaceae bacterium]